MIIKRVELKNFRNYKDEKIDFSQGLNYIYGFNAQGKTNILEALYFCGCSKSHRTSKDTILLKNGENKFSVKIFIEDRDKIEKEIQIIYDEKNKKKELKINGIKQKGMGDLFGNVNMIFFSPEDLMLIKEGPSIRRRQIDIALSQARPSYYYDLLRYHKILQQKNNLLKIIKNDASKVETLAVWNENLALHGANVMKKRIEYIKEISLIAKQKHLMISDNKEDLEIIYSSVIDINNDIKKSLEKKYNDNKEREIATGITAYGPHRDDILFYINGEEAKNVGSQGQQRSAVLSFKMAQLDYIGEKIGENPILLLDDVFSELDEKRRKFMYNNLKDIQTFITGTEKDENTALHFGEKKYYKIENGKVSDG